MAAKTQPRTRRQRNAGPTKQEAARDERLDRAAEIANEALLAGPRPIASEQTLSPREIGKYAEVLGRAVASKRAIIKVTGLSEAQLRAFARGEHEGRGLSSLPEASRDGFGGFYGRAKAANPSPRVRPRKAAAAVLGLARTAPKA
jgi:hypothetical protein